MCRCTHTSANHCWQAACTCSLSWISVLYSVPADRRSAPSAGGADDDAAEVEEDGWDVVQAPFLPPPPSQPDEVEHWTRAMFTDRQASRQQQQMQQQQARGHAGAGGGAGPGGGSGYSGRGGGQTGPQALGLDRVKAIFGK